MEEDKVIKNQDSKSSGFCYSAMILLYLLVILFGQVILIKVCETGSTAYIIVNSLFPLISVLVIIIAFSVIRKENVFNVTSVKKFKPEYIAVAVLISAGMFFGLGFINGCIANLLQNLGLKISKVSIPLNNVGEYITFSITLALLPAVIEEAFFRGLFLNGLKGIAPIIASLFCALFFAIYHLSLTQLVYQFIYGVFLSLLTIKAKSILPGIISHFINNFLVLSLQYFKIDVDLFNPIFIVVGIIALIGAGCILILYPKINGKSVKGEKANLFIPYGIIGLSVAVTLSVISLVI